MRSLVFYLLIGLFVYWIIVFSSPLASAQSMSNDNYILQLDDINTNTIHPNPGVSNNNTLGVTSEILDQKQPEPFLFSISQTLIDFSILSPTNPIKRSNKLTVSNTPKNGYSIIAFEDKELSASVSSDVDLPSSAFIPDTSCDNGQCSEFRSAIWTNPLTYGFGYRCDNVAGNDCASGFSDPTYYKQFANSSLSETPQKIAGAMTSGKNKTIQITYKVNIPGTQPFAFYNNTITFIAVPNY